jgi:prepilin peptidase CpaA
MNIGLKIDRLTHLFRASTAATGVITIRACRLPWGAAWCVFGCLAIVFAAACSQLGVSIDSQPITVNLVCAIGLLSVAAITDSLETKIYNALTYPAVLWGGAIGLASSVGSFLDAEIVWISRLSFGESLIGAVGLGCLMLVPYQLSRSGAGDVKLAAALGSLIGFEMGLWSLVIGYVLAAAFLVMRSTWLVVVKLPWASPFQLLIAVRLALRGLFDSPCSPRPARSPSVASQARSPSVASQALQPLPLGGFFAMGCFLTFVLNRLP